MRRSTLFVASYLKAFGRVLFALLLVTAMCSGTGRLQVIRDLEAAVATQPNNASAIRELAHSYALALLEGDENVARHAAGALDSSSNIWILGNAAYMLQCQHNERLQRGEPDERAGMLAERYFLRARSLDPKLDRNAILPRIDLQQIARANEARAKEQQEWARRFEEASKHIPRLGLAAFPGLPPVVAGVLRERGCTIPQPVGASTPRNVIRGEFFEAGQVSWAVLCSVKGWSAIIVFRTANDARPYSLAKREDRNYLQSVDEHSVGYSREIQSVGRDFIASHEHRSAGPKPERITHHGIDDAFLEKASETWYFDTGKWLKLPGAD